VDPARTVGRAEVAAPVLPTVFEARDALWVLAREQGALAVLYLNFIRGAKVEEIYGWEKFDAVMDTVAAGLLDCATHNALAVSLNPHDDNFAILHAPSAEPRDVEVRLAAAIEAAHGEEIAALCEIVTGRAELHLDPRMRFERIVYRAIREAAGAARSVEQRERLRRIAELKASIHDRAIYIDYHPIVSTPNGTVFGYEALARGTRKGLRRPEVMFEVAAEANLIWELSRLCRTTALDGLSRLGPNELLFLNVDPHDFSDPDFDLSGDPKRLVIEITERIAIKDYPRFRERLNAFRARGIRVAVDDAGSGFAGLGSIANLEPNFIKLDISLITGIDTSSTKQHLVETMVRFANEQGAMVIAEGVERAEEFAQVQRLGVHLVQGFYVDHSRPTISRSTRASDRLAAPSP
jgi:EAL domain-containing protein (putative c-di-GMP-specific phosphodiesterase class I)